MEVLGLDVGSSTIKGAVLDLDSGEIRGLLQTPFPGPLPGRPSGHHEVDADRVVSECLLIIDQLLAISSPAAILFCGQHGGFVLTDAAGQSVSPYVSWRDVRTSEADLASTSLTSQDACAARIGDARRQELGNELAPGGTLSLLCWMRQRGKLSAGLTPLGIAEYVLRRLGNGEPTIEPTCAIGMFDFATGDHPRDVHEALGLEILKWPKIQSYREPVGEYRHGQRNIPMHPVLGDHQCALLGAGLRMRELSLNVSTGSQVSLLGEQPELSSRHQTRCYFDGLTLNTLTHLPAGRSLNALAALMTEVSIESGAPVEDPWPAIMRLLEKSAPTDLRSKLTFFPGPLGSRGEIANISIDNLTVAGLFRAAFANMADNYVEAANRLNAAGRYERIVFSGGLVQKMPLLRQEILARFNGPSRSAEATEETLAGMLRAGRVIAGRSKLALTAPD